MGATDIEPRTTFDPSDEKLPAVLEILQRPDFTLEMCADEFQVTLPALCAFLTTDRGLSLLAETELAQAIHIRAIAITQLPRVVDAMRFALEDFADTCRNVPLDPNSMKACEFVERAKDTARRNGQLLLRLAHFSPRPLRSYAPPPNSPSHGGGREGAGGWVPCAPNHIERAQTSQPITNTNPTRERGVTPAPTPAPLTENQPHSSSLLPALTNPTRKRGATPPPMALPTRSNQNLPSHPALTSPERERAGCLPTSDIPHPKSHIEHPTSQIPLRPQTFPP